MTTTQTILVGLAAVFLILYLMRRRGRISNGD